MVMEFFLHNFLDDTSFPFFIQYGRHDRQMNLHRHHDYLELVCVLKGSALHQVDQEVLPLVRGDLFVIGPGVVHGYLDARDYRICNLMFRPDLLEGAAAWLADLPGYQALFAPGGVGARGSRFQARLRLDAGKLGLVEDAISRLVAEFNQRSPGWQPLVMGIFLELVVQLARWYQTQPVPAADDTVPVARGVAYMETNFHRNITLQDIAAQACLSPRHFSRLFRQSHGASPHRYLLDLRLHQACELLDATSLTVAQVAARCGFEDTSHFARQFARRLGQSPSAWRTRQKQV